MIRLLALLLAVQLGILAFLYWPTDAPVETRPSLLTVTDRSRIDYVDISEGSGAAVRLERDGQDWTLPSGLPANERKLDTLLDALLSQDPGLAVATSEGAALRFRVSPEVLERRVTVAEGDREQVVFLGDSPAFRQVYARRDGDGAIYAIDLNSFDAPTTESEWLDQTLLAWADVSSVTLYGTTLTRAGGAWSGDESGQGNLQNMGALMEALTNLRVSGIAEPENPILADATETLRIGIGTETGAGPESGTGNDGVQAELVVLRSQDSQETPEQFFFKDSRYEPTFDASAYDAQRLMDAVVSIFSDDETPQDLPETDYPQGPSTN